MAFDAKALGEMLKGARKEVLELNNEMAELVVRQSALTQRINLRQDFIRATMALLGESDEEPGETATTPPPPPPNPASQPTVLAGVPRDGYGSVTRGVTALLTANPDGFTAKDLAEQLQGAGFRVKDDYESAVRSALKNLRHQGKVSYNEVTSRYQWAEKESDPQLIT